MNEIREFGKGEDVELTLKSRFLFSLYPESVAHVFSENKPFVQHNEV